MGGRLSQGRTHAKLELGVPGSRAASVDYGPSSQQITHHQRHRLGQPGVLFRFPMDTVQVAGADDPPQVCQAARSERLQAGVGVGIECL